MNVIIIAHTPDEYPYEEDYTYMFPREKRGASVEYECIEASRLGMPRSCLVRLFCTRSSNLRQVFRQVYVAGRTVSKYRSTSRRSCSLHMELGMGLNFSWTVMRARGHAALFLLSEAAT